MSSFAYRAVAAFAVTALLHCRAYDVRVVADSVNLRAGAGLDCEVVGQVARGDILTAIDAEGEWIRVQVPTGIYLWVYGQLVKDSTAAARVMVRAGPGINYRVTGILNKGDPVKTVGTSPSGEWLKIEAPTGCSLWISSKYVEAVKSAEGVIPRVETAYRESAVVGERLQEHQSQQPAVSKPATAGPSEPATAGESVFQIPKELAGVRLAPGMEQGGRVEAEGILGPGGISSPRPAKWRLVKTDRRGHLVSAYYLVGNEERLGQLRGRVLIVSGRKYVVDGATYPVIVVEQIVRRD